ncbi:DNA sulfur modification protein DndD [Bhargavaea massiliensis]|uniref:DNA sulfur modification protein DndD n=1 Tax=Bhargavaea massiliensis TaxID=2697500 RepID=UPI001BD04B67|nr:DNA sulfur modification protein DndD [Bhargavaea massiliensis]
MLFKKLVFQNYKTYYGVQEINFSIPQSSDQEGPIKNIILIGGLNGAGKTTIINAIQDVLYGNRDISDEQYKKKFANVLNNTFYAEGGKTCSVSLFLETDNKEEWQLQVKWYFNNQKVMTHFERDLFIKPAGSSRVKKRKVEDTDAYNQLIDRIMPFHASPFFIFDGEEVKEVILRQSSNEMRDSIHKITGMHVYDQLLDDLYEAHRQIDRELSTALKSQKAGKLIEELSEVEDILEKNDKKLTVLRKKIGRVRDEKEKLSNQRQQILLSNSQSREEIVKKLIRNEENIKQVTNKLSNDYGKNVINIILSEQIKQLKSALKNEKDHREFKILKEQSLKPYRKFIDTLLNKEINPPLSNEQMAQIVRLGEEIWLDKSDSKEHVEELTELHDLTRNDYNTLMSITSYDKGNFSALRNQIASSKLENQRIMKELENAPEVQSTGGIDNKISNLSSEEGELSLRQRALVKKTNELDSKKTQLRNQISRLDLNRVGDFELLKKQLDQVTATIEALKEFIREDTKLKAQTIQAEFSSMLKTLFRKQDEFGKIEFDIESYSIRLYNDKMQEISIQDRSAGEMQMISSALIWALIKTSNLDLPVVIDTPLGRLDSHHRSQLINHYYSNLSQQVIILSTDTEITNDYINTMKQYTAREYLLDYDQTKKYTVIRDGYFNLIGGVK